MHAFKFLKIRKLAVRIKLFLLWGQYVQINETYEYGCNEKKPAALLFRN